MPMVAGYLAAVIASDQTYTSIDAPSLHCHIAVPACHSMVIMTPWLPLSDWLSLFETGRRTRARPEASALLTK
jgi:hypothetical protein